MGKSNDAFQGLMQAAGLESGAPATGSVDGYPAWRSLEKSLNMANYIDSLIGITFAGQDIDNATAIQQWIFRKVDEAYPGSGYYWSARVVNWDHSAAFGQPWVHEPVVGGEVLMQLKGISQYSALIEHPRFKAQFNSRLHAALQSSGAISSVGYQASVESHMSAIHGIVAADIARWLAEPDPEQFGEPSLGNFGPKSWLERASQLKATGSGSWYITNRQEYLLSLQASGFYVP